jgi:iron complex transport system permease protein
MQTLFRNPLADPFALGISSGASLGVALVVLGSGYGAAAAFGTAVGMQGDALITAAAITGAALVLGLVLLVSSGIANPTTVLILGLMFGYAVSAIVTARSMGLAVRHPRLLTMLGASVLGAVVTAFCGPISFLGIAVPHLCRGLLGTSDHRVLVPAVVLMGSAVALLAQIVSLLPGSAGVLPLNAVTSLMGAPIVVAVLLRSRRGACAG